MAVHPDLATVGAHAAARTVVALVDALDQRGEAHLVLTGGSASEAVSEALASSAACGAVDWARVHVWWGDERFVPAGHDDRLDAPALHGWLEAVGVPTEQVHRAPATDWPEPDDLDGAARRWAEELAAVAGDGRQAPDLDVVHLGVGPDGHVASLFPEHPGVRAGGTVVAVRDSPKPPPERLSLTLPVLCSARTVLLMAAGEEKARAVADGVAGAAPASRCPAGAARGTGSTWWLVDTAAAAALPASR